MSLLQRFSRPLAAVALLGAMASSVFAQGAFPSRPIKFIVPFAAGGTTDILARVMAQRLQTQLGQSVVVVNQAGAGGTIGANSIAKAPPDGYTLGIVSSAHAISPALFKAMPYKPLADFQPVVTLAQSANVLVTTPSFPVRNFAEFVAYAKANPGVINMGSAGLGGFQGALALTMVKTGIQVTKVPYNSGTQGVTELIAGRINAMWTNVLEAHEFVKAGKLRALAVTSPQRSPLLPDVPTMVEAGYADFHSDSWFSILLPAGTPAPVVERLNREFNAALADPEVRERLSQIGSPAAGGTVEQATTFLKSELARWEPLVRASGAKLE